MVAAWVYTPETALPDEMARLHRALHIQRVVIVTPSVYGTDNSATIYGLKARGNDARGVAVIDDKTSESEIEALDLAGFRGIRINLATVGITDPTVGRKRLQTAIELMKKYNWHVQLNINTATFAQIRELPVDSATAERIYDYRELYGRFSSVYDFLKIKGIDARKLEELKPIVYVPARDWQEGMLNNIQRIQKRAGSARPA